MEFIKKFIKNFFEVVIFPVKMAFVFFIYIFRFLDNISFRRNCKVRIIPGNNYAILVNGAGRIESWIFSFNKILNSSYKALKKRGFKEENIFIFSHFLIRENENGFHEKPSAERVMEILDKMKILGKRDNLVFHFIGHGHRMNNQSTLFLNNEDIFQREFFNAIKKIKAKKFFEFDQCFSGGFFNDAKKLSNIQVLSSTKENYSALPRPIEVFFWEKVGNGGKFIESYKKTAEEYKKRSFLDKLFSKIFYKTESFYLTYKKGRFELYKK